MTSESSSEASTTTAGTGLRQWTLDVDSERVAWLSFDRPGHSANALSRAAMTELNECLDAIEAARPVGLVIVSAKNGFIAGADVTEFAQVREPAEAVPAIRAAHGVLLRLERLPCPSVAAINGYCLGGGLELALACRHRVCADAPGVVLGLPEVMLGIHPGLWRHGPLRAAGGRYDGHGHDADGQEPASRQGTGRGARRSRRAA